MKIKTLKSLECFLLRVTLLVAVILLMTVHGVLASESQTTQPDPGQVNNNARSTGPMTGINSIVSAKVESQRHATTSSSPLVIPAADFRSDGYDPDSIFFFFGGGYIQGGNANSCVMAPAYLPNGATVYDIYASVVDNDAAANVWIRLFRVNNNTGVVNEMAYMYTDDVYHSPDIISLEDDSVDYPIVEYPTYSYYVGSCLASSAIHLYSVRIWYTVSATKPKVVVVPLQ
jgi:hypothetical protein